jgi:hypothetical protein
MIPTVIENYMSFSVICGRFDFLDKITWSLMKDWNFFKENNREITKKTIKENNVMWIIRILKANLLKDKGTRDEYIDLFLKDLKLMRIIIEVSD